MGGLTMTRNDNRRDKRIVDFIDTLFVEVGPSQQLFDLKEELATNMKERILDFQARGIDADAAFKEAVIAMGDLSGLVDDMRRIGQDTAKQSVYSSMSARISTIGLVSGVLLVLFGVLTSAMVYYMNISGVAAAGNGVFVVAGGVLVTYSFLTRETSRKYAMNKVRAALFALAIGLVLFAVFTAIMTHLAVGEMYITIASLMVFLLTGIGLFLFLVLTGTDRRKDTQRR